MSDPELTSIHVFGRTWSFTPAALEAMRGLGVGAPATLKTLAIVLRGSFHAEPAEYHLSYFSVRLWLSVDLRTVLVDCPEPQDG